MFAFVAFPKNSFFFNKLFVYNIPQQMLAKAKIGMQVVVPFGKRKTIGYIMSLSESACDNVDNIKDIEEIRGDCPYFFECYAKIAIWLSKYYISFIGSALKIILPPLIAPYEKLNSKTYFCPNFDNYEGEKILFNYDEDLLPELKKILMREEFSKNLIFNAEGKQLLDEYIKVASALLKLDKSLILLYPDLEYLNPTADIFRAKFGDSVVVIHSFMKEKERMNGWLNAYSGKAKIILGTRSAIFAPAKNLGMIIIDREEGYAYKQETSPKYNIKDVAFYLGKCKNIPVVLSSTFPTVDSYYRTVNREYNFIDLRMDSNIKNYPKIIDMANEKKFESGFFSSEALDRINDIIAKKGKILLITAKRAHSTILKCVECGHILLCPNCSLPLAYSMDRKKVVCLRCNNELPTHLVCSNCFSSRIKFSGFGAQKVDAEIRRIFKLAKVLRIDRDSIKRSTIGLALKNEIQKKDFNVVVGTLFAEKATEFINFDLIVFINLDVLLQGGSMTVSEEVFRSIYSLSKRTSSEILVQTYNPNHYIFKFVKELDAERFYEKELEFRKRFFDPPFSKVIKISFFANNFSDFEKTIQDFMGLLKKHQNIKILGPVLDNRRKKGDSIWHILLKGNDLGMIKQEINEFLSAYAKAKTKIVVDVDPID